MAAGTIKELVNTQISMTLNKVLSAFFIWPLPVAVIWMRLALILHHDAVEPFPTHVFVYSKYFPPIPEQKPVKAVDRHKVEVVSTFNINATDSVNEISALLPKNSVKPLSLSDRVLLSIIKYAGTIHGPTVDVIGQACRKLYILSRKKAVWQHLAHLANARKAPISVLPYADARHLFLLLPRIRTDGVYISKITYYRQVLSETSTGQAFNQVMYYRHQNFHEITYYRYLRFFGASESYAVWCMVTSKQPVEVLDLLRHPKHLTELESLVSGPTTGVFNGHWCREESRDRVIELRLEDMLGGRRSELRWYMCLELHDNTYKHRLLKCLEYFATNKKNGEPITIKTDDWGHFVFSKVHSYHT